VLIHGRVRVDVHQRATPLSRLVLNFTVQLAHRLDQAWVVRQQQVFFLSQWGLVFNQPVVDTGAQQTVANGGEALRTLGMTATHVMALAIGMGVKAGSAHGPIILKGVL
jgi:hypothetical protein